MLSWVHFGDLHITEANEPNHGDFIALVEDANRHLAGSVDFAVLPGDNADDGTEAQFRMVRAAADRLRMPLHILPGDHDFKPRNLDAFRAVLAASPLPAAHTVAGHRCVFLDMVSAGSGGPDFRLGAAQMAWLRKELEQAKNHGLPSVVFMHIYPADLREGAAEVATLFTRHRVLCVDMGHTHYNEIANDGHTIYAATRSTGQIEEGPVGFSLAAVDGGVVSWRFKPLGRPWPLVLITSPADDRMIVDPSAPDQVLRGPVNVRARIWGGAGIVRVRCRVDGGRAWTMAPIPDEPAMWHGVRDLSDLADGLHRLTVQAEDAAGGVDEDAITVRMSRSGACAAPRRAAPGSEANAIGAWPEKGIPGGQLGPNRNGRKW